MKNNILYLIAVVAACLFWNCSEVDNLHPFGPKDDVAPGTVSMVSYKATPGGADITVLPPTDEDLMYIKATYTLTNGEVREAVVSAYSNVISIEGFGDTAEQNISLSAVDRMENEGEPTIVSIVPGTPIYQTAFGTLRLGSTFGGVYVSVANPDHGSLIVELIRRNDDGEWQNVHTEYTSREDIRFSVRDMESQEYDFGAFIRDPWSNRTDTVFAKVTPLFEQELDYGKFAERFDKGDIRVDEWGFRMSNIWNGNYGWGAYNMLHTPERGNVWPAHFSFDLGVEVELSRIRYWQRLDSGGQWLYSHGNPRVFEIWGRADRPDPDSEWDGWTLLMTCESIKPSGLPLGLGMWNAEDREYAEQGEEFETPPGMGTVRYIRMNVLTNWSNSQFFCFQQMKFWGREVE